MGGSENMCAVVLLLFVLLPFISATPVVVQTNYPDDTQCEGDGDITKYVSDEGCYPDDDVYYQYFCNSTDYYYARIFHDSDCSGTPKDIWTFTAGQCLPAYHDPNASSIAVCTNLPRKPKCGDGCTGEAPACKCPVVPDPDSPSGSAVSIALGKHISVTATFGKPQSSTGEAIDISCLDVAGCNLPNCNDCISAFWTSNPTYCLPGCVGMTDPTPLLSVEPTSIGHAAMRHTNASRLHPPTARHEPAAVHTEVLSLKTQLQQLMQKNAALSQTIAEQAKTIEQLQAQIPREPKA